MNSHPFPAIWSSWWFGNESPIRILVDSSASRIHANYVLILLDPPLSQFFIILQGKPESHWCFQFLTRVLDGFFEFRILRVGEIDSSQFSCVVKMNLSRGCHIGWRRQRGGNSCVDASMCTSLLPTRSKTATHSTANPYPWSRSKPNLAVWDLPDWWAESVESRAAPV